MMTHAARPSSDNVCGVTSSEPADCAFRALVKTFGLLRRVMEPYFAKFGISGPQWGILWTLHDADQQGQPLLRLTDLGDRLIIRPPSVTGVVDRLQKMALVARSTSPTDQRAKFVRLTIKGRKLVGEILQQHPLQIRKVLGGLDETGQRDLQRLLEHLEPHLAAVADESEKETDE
jgi:DNA-binding MarR family transcriptional regulator